MFAKQKAGYKWNVSVRLLILYNNTYFDGILTLATFTFAAL